MKKIVLSILLFSILLAACGDDDNTIQDQNELLTAEIEKLKTELDNLKADQNNVLPIETIETKSIDDSIIGEWYNFSDFYKQSNQISFNEDGTGTHLSTGYDWEGTTLMHTDPDDTGVYTYDFKWQFEDGIVKVAYNDGNFQYSNGDGYNLDLTFFESEQQLKSLGSDGSIIEQFSREPAIIPTGYVTSSSIISERSNFTQPFLGEWYFDVFIWSFDEDGKLTIDVPAFGQYPANQLEYSFTLLADPYDEVDGIIHIDHPTSGLVMYEATFGNQSGGSLTLKPRPQGSSILLTKSFSLQNSPITDEILDEGMALFDAFETFTSLGRRR